MVTHRINFHQVPKPFSRLDFQNVVDQYKGDYKIHTWKCWDQFLYGDSPAFLFRGKRKMLLDNHPASVPFFEGTGPAGIFPAYLPALPCADIVQHAKEPGGIPVF